MRDKRIKVIYFSLKGSEVKDFAFSWEKLALFSAMLVIILTISVGGALSLFTNFYHSTRVLSLQKMNQHLEVQVKEMRENINLVSDRIRSLEGMDDDFRIIAGMDTLGQDIKSAGVGGPEPDYMNEFEFYPPDTRSEVLEARTLIDQLDKQLDLLSKSRKDITETLKKKQNEIDHLPTIKPVRGGRITALFGSRIDPFTGQLAPHQGIDIAAPVGTKVSAAAAGTVVRIERDYNRNRGYGKLVVIDHGFGIQTKYAHLSKILVKVGTKVKRWEEIGKVGNTGRSTGPHLHYEVVANEKPTNPVKYFFE